MRLRIVGGRGEELLDREIDFNGSSAVRREREFSACTVILRSVDQSRELKRSGGVRPFFDSDRLVSISNIGDRSASCDYAFLPLWQSELRHRWLRHR